MFYQNVIHTTYWHQKLWYSWKGPCYLIITQGFYYIGTNPVGLSFIKVSKDLPQYIYMCSLGNRYSHIIPCHDINILFYVRSPFDTILFPNGIPLRSCQIVKIHCIILSNAWFILHCFPFKSFINNNSVNRWNVINPRCYSFLSEKGKECVVTQHSIYEDIV